MRLIITGGGTGGHTSPALAILEELEARDPELRYIWVGRKNSYESRLCQRRHLPFRGVSVAPWPRKGRLRQALALLQLALGVFQCWILLRKFQPQAVVGVGGYVSLPLLWTAQRMGIPAYLHEQNKRMGMANRVLARNASRVFLSFAGTQGDYNRDRAHLTGNPVRAEFFNPPGREDACKRLGFDPDYQLVFFCGGSQGAAALNRVTAELLEELLGRSVNVLWMTGPAHVEEYRGLAFSHQATRLQIVPFVEDMVAACATADLLIMRAGASTTAEIAALGKPSVLVPYPHATDNHQMENALALAEAGAARILEERELSPAFLSQTIGELLEDPERLLAMGAAARALAQPNAAEQIAEYILTDAFYEARGTQTG